MSRTGQYLSVEFNKRKERNPRYSLRAFSRDLNLNPGRVSQFLSGKRPISQKMVGSLAAKLRLDNDARDYFLYLAEVDKKTKSSQKARVLQDDELALIAEWYHFTILSLIGTENFKFDYEWMSSRTGLPQDLIQISIERLLRLKVITEENGKLSLHSPHLSTSHDIPSSILRLSHKDSMQYILDNMEKIPVNLRDVTSITLPINENKIPAAKEMIKTFRRRLAKLMGQGKKTQVYTLNIQLFPLTESNETHA